VDSNQFTQQLVEFAGVQQQVQTNTLLQQLVTASQGNQVGSASSYIGTTIQATGNQIGLLNGSSTIGYNLASAASSVAITITDSSGNQVFNGTVNSSGLNAGNNGVPWNGTNSFTGAQEPDGVYTVSVKATDANGKDITATPFETGVVSSASISNGTVMLDVNGLAVPESNVTSVSNLPGTPSQTTTTTPQTTTPSS
jgi:flagellar basal-body rod modification protein FlgD